jgi:hypothetical protein
MSQEDLQSELQLDKDDWALIFSNDGNLKGLYIPVGKEDDEVPESLVHIMEEYFGIDFDDDELYQTIH